ncbi:hypothetical protein [Nocardia cyriacigeorgica]|uniref:hypothetical protein n=1 Tax=Nocardia cyriacigeorgica TaxID=135487 RepID=UPI001893EBAE|nr:hypothetical protein [Nocardia cyriacigeorgica]MBF6412933.1 hypothetical protein [Nocardia cyriacigeorgica]
MNIDKDPVPQAEAADRIWAVVEPTGDYGGLRRNQICEQTQLTRSQFENGKAGIRDHKARDEGKAFIYDGDVYAATTVPARCAKAAILQLRRVDKQLRRMKSSTFEPLAPEVRAQDPALTYAVAKIESTVAEMTLLHELGFSPSSPQFQTIVGKHP